MPHNLAALRWLSTAPGPQATLPSPVPRAVESSGDRPLDATMHTVQPSQRHAALDGSATTAELAQLPHRHHAVLARGQTGEPSISCLTLFIYSMGNCRQVRHGAHAPTLGAKRASTT